MGGRQRARWLRVAAAQDIPVEFDAVLRERHTLDVAGHGHRPELFSLGVDRRRVQPAHSFDPPMGHAAPPPGPPPPPPSDSHEP